MKRLMISAMSSGSGKTVVTCGLLALLKRRGLCVRSVKCGPDYIDPMFHSRVLGVEGANADLFLMGEDTVRNTMCGNASGEETFHANATFAGDSAEITSYGNASGEGAFHANVTLAEGAMGFYDGIGGTTENSAWDIADRTGTPVILVLRSRGQSISLAAQVLGFMNFRKPSHICGLLLTECSPSLHAHLAPILERETGLPVLGYLPAMEEAEIPSRHLGLVTASEIEDLRGRFEVIADQMECTVDVEKLLGLFGEGEETRKICDEEVCKGISAEKDAMRKSASATGNSAKAGAECEQTSGMKHSFVFHPRIAVARDEAFCFYYTESLAALEAAGAELVFFSPIHDRKLPENISGLYLGGGYPELYAKELSRNAEMLKEIRRAFAELMPMIVECGGFLYLQKYLADESGRTYEMAGTFAGTGSPTGHLVRFGYLRLNAAEDSLLFRKGETIPAHEFHHWDTDDNGADLEAVRARGGEPWRCAHVKDWLYAGFPHISLGGEIPLARRFVEAACLHW